MTTTRAWHLVRRPRGEPQPADVAMRESSLRDPGPEQVLVRNTWLSVDPYMRGRMNDVPSYVPPFRLDAPMQGGAIGVVEAAGAEANDASGRPLRAGDTVLHDSGWRTHALVLGRHARAVVDERVPPQSYLGVLGMPGLTAYVGLTRIGGLRPGDRVLVTAAAGAVGSLAGQLARRHGASLVVGSAGGPEKAAWLTEQAGFDAAIDYRSGSFAAGLRVAAPEGLDLVFDNVGGEQLEAALGEMRDFGRIAACGMIAGYNATRPAPGPANLWLLIARRLSLRGFIVTDHEDLRSAFEAEVGGWVADGSVESPETVHDGIESAYPAFLAMMRGENLGKMLIRL